jgi:formylglycine-generating enzyme
MRHLLRLVALGVALGFAACATTDNDGVNSAAGGGGATGAGGSGGSSGDSGETTDVAEDAGAIEFVPTSPSCAAGLTCKGGSCCTSVVVPGGTFPQGRSAVPGARDYYTSGSLNELPEFSATVSSFALDKYEVTVGRFRAFVDAYVGNGADGAAATVPAEGAGANPNVPIAGEASDNGTGWQSAWNAFLPADQAAFKDTTHLKCYSGFETWTDAAGANENHAINCVSWYEAFAFCIWDGGRLPTESEWEYAAAGGTDNRMYPWGSYDPDCSYANAKYARTYCSGGAGSVFAVGSSPKGNGKWGQADLAGNVHEWTLDWHGAYPATAVSDYANIADNTFRVIRGGCITDDNPALRVAYREVSFLPGSHAAAHGLRCARAVQ